MSSKACTLGKLTKSYAPISPICPKTTEAFGIMLFHNEHRRPHGSSGILPHFPCRTRDLSRILRAARTKIVSSSVPHASIRRFAMTGMIRLAPCTRSNPEVSGRWARKHAGKTKAPSDVVRPGCWQDSRPDTFLLCREDLVETAVLSTRKFERPCECASGKNFADQAVRIFPTCPEPPDCTQFADARPH